MTEERKSHFHTLATVSALAVPVLFGANMLLRSTASAVPASSRGAVELAISMVVGVLLLAGVLAGIVAMFGIRRYGKRGILWKALVGILVPILLFLLALPAIFASKQIASKNFSLATRQNQLVMVEKRLNKQCPVMVDEVTRLDGVQIRGENSLVFNSTLTTMLKSDFPDGEFESQMQAIIVDAYNSAPDMKLYRDGGVTLINRYIDKSGAFVAEISVGPEDLRNR